MLGATVLEARPTQVQSDPKANANAHAASGSRAPRVDASRELRHELGNALAAASANAQWLLLRRSSNLGEREYRALQAIRDSVARALRLIDRDNRDARDERTAPQSPTPRHLQDLVEVAVRQVPFPRVHDIHVRRMTLEAPSVSADPDAVVQIVTNLLGNAAKYSPPGTPIDVEVDCAYGKAHLIVRDRGIGFEPELTEAIFDGFRTPRAREMADGEGIGLRLSRRLAHEAGGRLWATSVPGRTTSFHLELPLSRTASN